jgi:hypothetical protein
MMLILFFFPFLLSVSLIIRNMTVFLARFNNAKEVESSTRGSSHGHINMLQVVHLMRLNGKRAVQMLINQSDSIDATEVVSQLQKEDQDGELRKYLHLYLHSLFEKDPTAAKEYHGLQVFAISLVLTHLTVPGSAIFCKLVTNT